MRTAEEIAADAWGCDDVEALGKPVGAWGCGDVEALASHVVALQKRLDALEGEKGEDEELPEELRLKKLSEAVADYWRECDAIRARAADAQQGEPTGEAARQKEELRAERAQAARIRACAMNVVEWGLPESRECPPALRESIRALDGALKGAEVQTKPPPGVTLGAPAVITTGVLTTENKLTEMHEHVARIQSTVEPVLKAVAVLNDAARACPKDTLVGS